MDYCVRFPGADISDPVGVKRRYPFDNLKQIEKRMLIRCVCLYRPSAADVQISEHPMSNVQCPVSRFLYPWLLVIPCWLLDIESFNRELSGMQKLFQLILVIYISGSSCTWSNAINKSRALYVNPSANFFLNLSDDSSALIILKSVCDSIYLFVLLNVTNFIHYTEYLFSK